MDDERFEAQVELISFIGGMAVLAMAIGTVVAILVGLGYIWENGHG